MLLKKHMTRMNVRLATAARKYRTRMLAVLAQGWHLPIRAFILCPNPLAHLPHRAPSCPLAHCATMKAASVALLKGLFWYCSNAASLWDWLQAGR